MFKNNDIYYLLRDFNTNTRNLYSRTLISTRLSIIDEEKQYQNEIKYKTQCLKKNNTVQIEAVNESTSDFREKFIFNKKAFIQFTYIGVTGTEEEPGIYKIKIPNDYTFGILYDFEEDLNKKYSRDIVETLIYISKGTTYGEPRIIKEDKWIRTPGDLPNNEDSEGILNIGRYEFNVQFYKGNIELTVTGDFGTISYYCIKNGYMGGQKRLKYSDICLKV